MMRLISTKTLAAERQRKVHKVLSVVMPKIFLKLSVEEYDTPGYLIDIATNFIRHFSGFIDGLPLSGTPIYKRQQAERIFTIMGELIHCEAISYQEALEVCEGLPEVIQGIDDSQLSNNMIQYCVEKGMSKATTIRENSRNVLVSPLLPVVARNVNLEDMEYSSENLEDLRILTLFIGDMVVEKTKRNLNGPNLKAAQKTNKFFAKAVTNGLLTAAEVMSLDEASGTHSMEGDQFKALWDQRHMFNDERFCLLLKLQLMLWLTADASEISIKDFRKVLREDPRAIELPPSLLLPLVSRELTHWNTKAYWSPPASVRDNYYPNEALTRPFKTSERSL